jgi:uncharacterized membrane protein YfcA
MTWLTALVATTVIAIGAVVQGTIGFGMGLFAAPILALMDHRLVPGPLIAAGMVLTLLVARREWDSVRRPDLGWALGGRVFGIVLAVLILGIATPAGTDFLLGVLILCAVAMSASGVPIALRPRTLVGAGAISGFFATTSSVGGPPMALLYQHESGARIRATLSAYFLIGGAMSLIGLAIGGHYRWPEVADSVVLVPGVLVGYALSRRSSGALRQHLVRRLILVISSGSALMLIARQLL